MVFGEPNIEFYRCVKGDIDRQEAEVNITSHTDKSRYWALQTPIIVLLLFRVKRLVDTVKIAMFSSARLQIIILFICLYYLFIYLFVPLILVKYFYRSILTFNTFEDAIQPLVVEMYMLTYLLHAFSITSFDTHAKTPVRTTS